MLSVASVQLLLSANEVFSYAVQCEQHGDAFTELTGAYCTVRQLVAKLHR